MKVVLPFLLIGVIVLSSCASKRNYNKAQKFDESGLYTDAAALYLKSVVANSNNIDAKLGLQRTGQLVLDDKVEAFKNQYQNGAIKDAVYAYREAESYYNQLSSVGVKLNIDDQQSVYYQEVKDQYLDQLYQQAMKALSLEEFAGAESQLSEVLTFDKRYKDAQSQWITAKYEPVYRQGNQRIAGEMFRSAYGDFNIINLATKGYKNSIELQSECLSKAQVTIAVLPFTYKFMGLSSYSSAVKSNVLGKVSQLNSPFYQVISDDAISSIPGWASIKDQSLAVNMARKLQNFEAKSILSAQIEKFNRNSGKLIKLEKRGYLKKTVDVKNEETGSTEKKTVYSKIRYYEYKQTNSVLLSLNYSLNRIDKSELAFSDQFYKEETDEVHYAKFDGDYKQLIPGYWKYSDRESAEDRIEDNETSRKELQQLFSAKKEIASIQTLESNLFQLCGDHVANNILNYKPEN